MLHEDSAEVENGLREAGFFRPVTILDIRICERMHFCISLLLASLPRQPRQQMSRGWELTLVEKIFFLI
jgi:hypothetical protein